MHKFLKRQWRKKAVRVATAVLLGSCLAALCELAPEAFKAQCHLAAKLVHVVMGVP